MTNRHIKLKNPQIEGNVITIYRKIESEFSCGSYIYFDNNGVQKLELQGITKRLLSEIEREAVAQLILN